MLEVETMADKRMFSKRMISSDAFLEMPLTAQGLFFHLCMRADDEGIVDSPKKIMRECQAKQKDLDILIQKRYLLTFPSGVVLIKHWKIHNTIPKDRFVPSTYTEELSTVMVKDNKAYTERRQNDYNSSTNCNQNDTPDKNREDKSREEKNNICAAEPHEMDLEDFFESIWLIYPLKRGKGQVSKAKKKVLHRIGFEHMKRCIERYVEELKATGKEKYMQHGSTFFNSGYVDYLDENYNYSESEIESAAVDKASVQEDEELVGDDW